MKLTFFLVFILLSNILLSQKTQEFSSSSILHELKKINTLGSVLYIAAHPDDENTRLLAYMANERKYRTGYLSLTRGDGGQNLIGSEQGEALGLIRTQELLAARRTDGAEQFFTRANDFGYSKNPEETLSIWDKDSILADVVWCIRNFKPDVIICRFPTTGEGGHGHHTASAILAEEAFTAAADPKKFPHQLKYTQVWQAERLFWNTFNFGGNNTTSPDQLQLDAGGFNPLLGMSYGEIAAESRTMHKSQGFGTAPQRGESIEYFKFLKGTAVKTDLFEGINTTWNRIPNGKAIEQLINEIASEFNYLAPEKSLKKLTDVYRKIETLSDTDPVVAYWKKIKLEACKELIVQCAGLWMESTSKDFSAAPGEITDVNLQLVLRNPCQAKLISIESETKNTPLTHNKLETFSTTMRHPTTRRYSDPYWLKHPTKHELFDVRNQLLIGTPENSAGDYDHFVVEIEGLPLTFDVPTRYKYTDPVKGEVHRPLEILPPVTINLSDKVLVFDGAKSKEITLVVKSNKDNLEGNVQIQVPAGWTVSLPDPTIRLAKKGEELLVKAILTATDKAKNGLLEAQVLIGKEKYNKSITRIEYDHIPYQFFLKDAQVKLVVLDVKKEKTTIGYIPGAGDDVVACLEQIGYQVTLLTDEQIAKDDLSKYASIITGIRAYNTNKRLFLHHTKLMDYVKNGGNLIVQYNTNNRIAAMNDEIGPYSFTISRTRVTDEKASIAVTNKNHAALTFPNVISEKDFEGWVQERGIYFVDQYAKEYETLLTMNDPGEKSSDGSLLIGKYGKGNFVYTGLAFFRQLPAGVPGAYRLFVNLISLPQN